MSADDQRAAGDDVWREGHATVVDNFVTIETNTQFSFKSALFLKT